MQSLQMNRGVAHWALLPSYQDHFRTEFRTEVNFSQKLQPSVDTQNNTRERANRKWSNSLFHLCGRKKPQELTQELKAWCLCPLGVLPFPLLLINKHFSGKDTLVFLNCHVLCSTTVENLLTIFSTVPTLTSSKAGPHSSLHKPYNNSLNPQLNSSPNY